jgi:hypothetical protein
MFFCFKFSFVCVNWELIGAGPGRALAPRPGLGWPCRGTKALPPAKLKKGVTKGWAGTYRKTKAAIRRLAEAVKESCKGNLEQDIFIGHAA